MDIRGSILREKATRKRKECDSRGFENESERATIAGRAIGKGFGTGYFGLIVVVE
jgi:hypothetical protein